MKSLELFMLTSALGALIAACNPEAAIEYRDRTSYVCADSLVSVDAPADCGAEAADVDQNSGSSGSSDVGLTMAGTLNIAGAGLGLINSSQTYFKCVTTTLDTNESCIDTVSAEGAFQLTCSTAFQNQGFGCFILEGMDESSLEIVGMIASSDFNVASATNAISMDIQFDRTTGASSVKMEQKMKQQDGTTIAVDSGSIGAKVPNYLKALMIPSGNYNVCQMPINDAKDAIKGTFSNPTECDWGENKYFAFTPATEKRYPFLEIWKDQKAYERCHNPDGDLEYELSDGTNSVAFTAESITFSSMLSTIINNHWTEQSEIDNYQQAVADADASEDTWVADFKSTFSGSSSACSDYANTAEVIINSDKIVFDIPSWAKSDTNIDTSWVWKECNIYELDAFDFPSLDSHKFQASIYEWPTQEGCRLLKEGEMTAAQVKTYMHDQCVAMYEIDHNVAWAANSLVSSALWVFDEVKYGDHGADLRFAFEELVNMANDLSVDLESTPPADLAANADLQELAQALAVEFGEQDWHWERQQLFKCIGEAGTLLEPVASCPVDFDLEVGTPQLSSLGNLGELFWQLFQQEDPFWAAGGHSQNNSASQFAEEQVCAQEYEMDLRGLSYDDAGSDHDPESFWSSAYYGPYTDEWGNQHHQWQLKSSVTATKWSVTKGFVDYVIDNDLVQNCTKIRFQSFRSDLTTWENDSSWNPEEYIFAELAGNLSQSRWREIETVLSQDADQDGTDGVEADDETEAGEDLAALAANVLQLALNNLGEWDARYILSDFCYSYGELADYTDLEYEGASITLSCNSQVPEELQSILSSVCHVDSSTGFCQFPEKSEYLTNVSALSYLKQRIADIKRWFPNSDPLYQKNKQKLKKFSRCIPSFSLGWEPKVSSNDLGFTFPVTIKGPVKRSLASSIMPQFAADGSTTQKFMVMSTDFENVERGGDEGDCHYGEKRSLTYAGLDMETQSITGIWTEAFVDTCWNDQASTDDSGWNQAITATFQN